MKKKKALLWKIPLALISIILAAVLALAAVVAVQGIDGWREWEEWQKEHVEGLSFNVPATDKEAYALEMQRTGVDVEQAVKDGVSFNRLRGLITHNSYKQQMPAVGSVIFDSLYKFGVGREGEYEYKFPSLSEQLSSGVMGLELDLSYYSGKDGDELLFCHVPLLDMNSSAINAGLAVKEIALWSEANPKHLPIVILLEPKDVSIPGFRLHGMDNEHLQEFDKLLRDNLGDSLLTPNDMLGGYSDFGALRADDGWLPLEQTLGKVIVLLHPGDLTEDYIALDQSLRTQAMFPAMQWQQGASPQASFVLANYPDVAYQNSRQLLEEQNLIVRTRIDSYPEHSLEDYFYAMNCGAQWISTDYPPCASNGNEKAETYCYKLTARSAVASAKDSVIIVSFDAAGNISSSFADGSEESKFASEFRYVSSFTPTDGSRIITAEIAP
ncbi:MAG: hypothetical protein LBQ80_01410 [Clostridium sp.]|jgi:hypothetical protein|nr:hypothetical protein [Clostridium sp.]